MNERGDILTENNIDRILSLGLYLGLKIPLTLIVDIGSSS
jgi:hypothetical protein